MNTLLTQSLVAQDEQEKASSLERGPLLRRGRGTIDSNLLGVHGDGEVGISEGGRELEVTTTFKYISHLAQAESTHGSSGYAQMNRP